MNTTAPQYFDLGPTATYRRRRAGWFPVGTLGSRGEHETERAGTLRIVLELDGRGPDATEVDNYGVQEEFGHSLPVGVRSFLLRNDTDEEQPDVYRCVVGFDAGGMIHDRCTCRAGELGKVCKHADALNRLVLEWVL